MKKGKSITGEWGAKEIIGSLLKLSNSEPINRRRVDSTEVKRFFVSTVKAPDFNVYETAIQHKGLLRSINKSEWIIVEEYKTKKEAQKGHKDWVEYCKTNPKKFWEIRLGKVIK